MTLSIRSPRARWLVPVAAAAAIGIGVGASSVVAGAATTLPPKTAAQLLADLARTPQQPLSGTVVQTSRLGLPELPGPDTASFQSLLSGSHTARVWYGSPTQARISLIGDLAQADVIRRGSEVWTWSSSENTATRYTLPADAKKAGRLPGASPTGAAAIDPAAAAELALDSIDPTTAVSVDGSNKVAGRSAYELVLAPRDARSLVGEVRLAVDSETSVPLRVQVFAQGATEAAVETAFTSVQFERPADSVFAFTPPAGAKVVEGTVGAKAGAVRDAAGAAQTKDLAGAARAARGARDAAKDVAARAGAPRLVGSGWTSVAVVEDAGLAAVEDSPVGGALLGATTRVTGSYGSGRLLSTPLLSVLILDDGTVLAGAVQPAVLDEVAGTLGDR
jgi:outer membrane lipoprotein-sorting protein